MKKTQNICLSALLFGLMLLGSAANAALVEIELLDLYGEFDGAPLTYDFSSLAASDGTGGSLRLRTGESQTSTFDGLDLDGQDEFFDFIVDGNTAGQYACGTQNGATELVGNTGGIDCDFDVTFTFAELGLDFASLIGDGSLNVVLDFTDAVNFSSEQDEVFVTLSYNSLVTEVSTPATFAVFALGVAGLVWSRRKAV